MSKQREYIETWISEHWEDLLLEIHDWGLVWDFVEKDLEEGEQQAA